MFFQCVTKGLMRVSAVAPASIPEPEARAIIGDRLNAFNDAIVGYADRTPLTVKVSDPDTGAVVGGIAGGTSLGLLFVDLVFLPDGLRGQNIGMRMMAKPAAAAAEPACFTPSASRPPGSAKNWDGGSLGRFRAIHPAPAVSF